MSAPEFRASTNDLVPDLAMVPKLLMSSLRVMPIPLSQMVSVLLVLSGITLMNMFSSLCNSSGFSMPF